VAFTYNATATDAVDGTDATVCNPVSGSTLPFGLDRIKCHAADATGNASVAKLVHDGCRHDAACRHGSVEHQRRRDERGRCCRHLRHERL